MGRFEVDAEFVRVEALARSANQLVSEGTRGSTDFRAELAGLLVVAIAVSYENCVRNTLCRYSDTRHVDFGVFTTNNFEKLNSKVALSDLYRYCKLFGVSIHREFKESLKARNQRVNERTGVDMIGCYSQILSWRHAYAHAGIKNTTIGECLRTYRIGKRILYEFDIAFSRKLDRGTV